MTIVFVRHGETEGNATRVLQTADTPLNERGLLQAERLSRRLSGEPIAQVLCSDLLRARMTAAPLVARTGAPIEHSALLAERNFGELRGTPHDRLGYDVFAPDFVPPGGESWREFEARVAEAFALVLRARERAGGTLVVVTHGLVCGVLMRNHVRLPDGQAAPGRYGNTSVTICEPAAPHRVMLLNCTAHLADLPGPEGLSLGAA